jgi:hypothetical protein
MIVGMVVLVVIGVLVNPSYAEIDPETVIGVWLFDEDGGTAVKDYSVNGNHGTIMGAPEWVDGKFGTALKLNGSTDYVLIQNSDSFNSPAETNGLTMLAWANRTAIRGGWEEVISKWKAGAAGSSYRLHVHETDGNWESFIRNAADANNITITGTPGKEDTWVHLAVTYDGSTTKIYQDGLMVSSGANAGGIHASDLDVSIGKRTGDNEFFAGIVDEVAIFNVALSEDDIQNIMTKGLESALGTSAVGPLDKLATTWASIKARY